jgi:hypothetical protein
MLYAEHIYYPLSERLKRHPIQHSYAHVREMDLIYHILTSQRFDRGLHKQSYVVSIYFGQPKNCYITYLVLSFKHTYLEAHMYKF